MVNKINHGHVVFVHARLKAKSCFVQSEQTSEERNTPREHITLKGKARFLKPNNTLTSTMASISSTSSSGRCACMICLSNLLSYEPPPSSDPNEDDNKNDDDEDNSEIGAVFPCGHVFHLKCWNQWQTGKHAKCPTCRQEATLFSKLFISAPPPPQQPDAKVPAQVVLPNLSLEDVFNGNMEEDGVEEELDESQVLLDMRTAEQECPAQMIQKVVSLGCKMRKLRRCDRKRQSELESIKLVLQITQEELEMANEELQKKNRKVLQCEEKLGRIQTLHWQRHRILHEELVSKHANETRALQKELAQARADLALRNRQLLHWTGNEARAENF